MALETRTRPRSGTRDTIRALTIPEPGSVADRLLPLIELLVGLDGVIRVECWDGSAAGPVAPRGTLQLTPEAARRLLWSPDELGLARAYVSGDLVVDGDLFAILDQLRDTPPRDARLVFTMVNRGWRVATVPGVLGRPLPPPPEEVRPRGRRHSIRRDSTSVSHHYDVGNEFYALVLGPSMTYSCARFPGPDATLEIAQASKHELVCRKLGLHARPGAHLLDIGCGWGSLAMHAAKEHGAHVVGITISEEQASGAQARVREAGLEEQVEIRVQDYRELAGERFDAVASIGMFEHVGTARTAEYFGVVRSMLGDEGRLLNHAISSVGNTRLRGRKFMHRYVFPDGELLDVGQVVLAMERAGFEVRDVESLREHYALTLRRWVANLERSWDEAVALVGPNRARVWLLYMAASALGFEDGGIAVHQVLGVVPDPDGASGMPPTRDGWATGG